MKKGVCLLLVIAAVATLSAPFVLARAEPPAPRYAASACISFGVQVPEERREAPSFTLKTLDGRQVHLGNLKGKPVLLKFWATWCPSCIEELPMMEKFSEGKREQLVILMAAIDGENEKKVRRVIDKSKVTLPVLLDAKEKIARAYGVKFIPISFLINPEGLIVGTIVGERNWCSPEAWSAVKELLNLR
jgi:peroxiredoxin